MAYLPVIFMCVFFWVLHVLWSMCLFSLSCSLTLTCRLLLQSVGILVFYINFPWTLSFFSPKKSRDFVIETLKIFHDLSKILNNNFILLGSKYLCDFNSRRKQLAMFVDRTLAID